MMRIGKSHYTKVVPRARFETVDQQRAMEAVTEAIAVSHGVRGNPLDRSVTFRDLKESGLIKIRDLVVRPNVPTFQDINASDRTYGEPPILTNVKASGGFKAILIQWDDPQYAGLRYVEIFRNNVDNQANAVRIGTSVSFLYSDEVGFDKEYYYWVRVVARDGRVGPFHAVHGLYARTAPDIQQRITDLSDDINNSELVLEMLAGDRFNGLASDVTSLAESIIQLTNGQHNNFDLIRGENTAAIQSLRHATELRFAEANQTINTIRDLTHQNNEANELSTIRLTEIITANEQAATQAIQSLTTSINSAGDDINALSGSLTSLITSLKIPSTNEVITGLAFEQLQSNVSVIDGNVSAVSSQITGVETRLTNAEGAITSQSSAFNVLESRVAANESGVTSAATTANGVLARLNNPNFYDDEISTQVGQTFDTRISAFTDANGNIKDPVVRNSYVLNMATDVGGRRVVAGFGLAQEVDTGTGSSLSEFYVLADRFAILDPNQVNTTNAQHPFIVANDPDTNTPAVYINNAMMNRAHVLNLIAGHVTADEVVSNISITTPRILAPSINVLSNGQRQGNFSVDANGIMHARGALIEGNTVIRGNALIEQNVTIRGHLEGATGTFSGTLTAHAINAVDTLNIAGNAITAPILLRFAPSMTVGLSWPPLSDRRLTNHKYAYQTLTFDTKGEKVVFVISMGVGAGYNPVDPDDSAETGEGHILVYRGGQLVGSGYSTNSPTSGSRQECVIINDSGGSGVETYEIYYGSSDNISSGTHHRLGDNCEVLMVGFYR